MLFISNFVLDIYNIIMKNLKTYLMLILVGTTTFTIGVWFYSTQEALTSFEYIVAGLVFVIVVISTIVGLKRLKEAKHGMPPEDELSIQIKQKAAAVAFSFSFIIWTMILIFMGDKNVSPTIQIGIGIVSTGLLFLILWLYYMKTGLGNEDKN